ncbi:bifunctional folylpolyglutamate synthase/dihydrofolate synthase [Deinococcus pimensis]|uniref:bifunctional folylpolyglutamate synthase/dihydrofolate synthase n=1 Tax=Deinococcus pimensis TaxID=309888 RepID=UPI0005EB89AC|nr:folylpolyglutamate synthase/dihydrofolate synthase family protein [Deinococcus pimensis]
MTPGLERTHALLARLGGPQDALRVVLVGGTNGKGSTAATLASVLAASGDPVGLFTSPHLTRFAERFRVGVEGPPAELPTPVVLDALARVRPQAEAVGASFFEIVTALGVLLFAEGGVRTAVMEVGLGGRLDATNALDPALSVVTNVGLDHTEILGETVGLIAAEKAGILREGRVAVTGASGEALEVLRAARADLRVLDEDARFSAHSLGWDGWEVTLQDGGGQVAFRTPLLGPHGARNAALAALAARTLGVAPGAVERGAPGTEWPGRMELLRVGARTVLLDGAHNPEGARALVTALRGLGVDRVPLVFGAAADKDLSGLAEALEEVASEVVLTRAELSPRAADPHALAGLWRVPTRVAATPGEALSLLPEGLSVVAGSLYLVGEVRPLLLGERAEGRERWQ